MIADLKIGDLITLGNTDIIYLAIIIDFDDKTETYIVYRLMCNWNPVFHIGSVGYKQAILTMRYNL